MYKLVERRVFSYEEGQGSLLDVIVPIANQMRAVLVQRDPHAEQKTIQPIYRGESCDYGRSRLCPLVFRKMVNNSALGCNYEKKLTTYFLEMYKDQYDREDPLVYLSRMQHYSFPTRLLDWTTDILVALYFCCNSNFDRDGYLYIFIPTMTYKSGEVFLDPLEAFQESLKYHYYQQVFMSHTEAAYQEFWRNFLSLSKDNVDSLIIPWCFAFKPVYRDQNNRREYRQKSVFTFHNGYVDGQQLIIDPKIKGCSFAAQSVSGLLIPSKFKRRILSELNSLNITMSALFCEPVFYEEESLLGIQGSFPY